MASNLNPSSGQRQKAFALALLIFCCGVLMLPLANTHVPRAESLMHIADTAQVLLSFAVAFLLFAQFAVFRSNALLALACGFLLVSLTTLPQLPGLSLGVSMHAGQRLATDLSLPLAVLGYAWLCRAQSFGKSSYAFDPVAASVATTVLLAAGLSWMTSGVRFDQPAVSAAASWPLFTALPAIASAAAILFVWQRPPSMLDLWLMVAMTAWLIKALLETLAPDGMSFAWQIAQLYGAFGVACVAMALLAENANLHARLAGILHTRDRLHGDAAIDVIADQVKQPLCAIAANASAVAWMLEQQPRDLQEIRAALADIGDDAHRASESLRAAQCLSRNVDEPPSVLDVGQLVNECLSQLSSEMLVHRVSCEVATARHLPEIHGSRWQLLQMLTNLVTNSLEAMSSMQHGERRLRVRASRHDARTVAIWVEDSGGGIPPEHAARIFDPFFTTKPHRPGLGLAICRTIAVAHGGHISLAAYQGGAAFRVILPAGS